MSDNVRPPAPSHNVQSLETHGPASPFHAVPESGEARGVGLSASHRQDDVERAEGSQKNASPTAGEYACFEQDQEEYPTEGTWLTDAHRKALISAMYMSCFAVLGALLRIVLAQFFGEECRNPGTVGWIRTEQPLCVTADGEASRQGGIVFSDLPANLLGSFIMGMFQSGDALGLPVSAPVVFLSTSSFFQSWDVIHLAIRTGFCGSLTTFSSWNSEMVVMMFGTGNSKHSQFARALFGYLIGMETALGSFVFGRNVALWIHRKVNQNLAKEADEIKMKREEGVYINRELPEFERRFLPDLDMDMEPCEPEMVQMLFNYRRTTKESRRVGSELLPALREVEHEVLVLGNHLRGELRQVAQKAGWDVDALEGWSDEKKRRGFGLVHHKKQFEATSFSTHVALPIFITCTILLVIGIILVDGDDAYSITYRTMMYAALFAPPGALLRWKLSGLNGKIGGSWSWLPAGTLAANVLASLVSIVAISSDYVMEVNESQFSGFWLSGTLRAVKIGFAGCLSTVSTFVAEITSMMAGAPKHFRGYTYVFISLSVSCIVSVAAYGCITSVYI